MAGLPSKRAGGPRRDDLCNQDKWAQQTPLDPAARNSFEQWCSQEARASTWVLAATARQQTQPAFPSDDLTDVLTATTGWLSVAAAAGTPMHCTIFLVCGSESSPAGADLSQHKHTAKAEARMHARTHTGPTPRSLRLGEAASARTHRCHRITAAAV